MTNPGIFQIIFSTFWLTEPKCTESDLKKSFVPFGVNLTHFWSKSGDPGPGAGGVRGEGETDSDVGRSTVHPCIQFSKSPLNQLIEVLLCFPFSYSRLNSQIVTNQNT